MKKIISILLVLSLFLGFTTNVFAAAGDKQFEQGVALIENANVAIDAKIAVAVEQADVLKNDYLTQIRTVEQAEIGRLQREITRLEEAIATGTYSKTDVNEMNKKIEELKGQITNVSLNLENSLALISQDIEAFMATVGPEVTPTNEDLYKAVEELTTKINNKAKKYEVLTNNYVKKLNLVITDCYNVTLAMSKDAMSKAAQKGVVAECSWKLVRFGHLWVWIDPIRIIGRN